MNRMRKSAFTLIEMLIVIVVIGILSGIVFRLMGLADRNRRMAVTVANLEKVAYALNEFKAEYGIYPPAGNLTYYYASTNDKLMPPAVKQYFEKNANATNAYKFGVVWYISSQEVGFKNNAYKSITPDMKNQMDREEALKSRWSEFLKNGRQSIVGAADGDDDRGDLDGYTEDGAVNLKEMSSGADQSMKYTPMKRTIRDGWDKRLRYMCSPPYQKYELYSFGSGQRIRRDNKWNE